MRIKRIVGGTVAVIALMAGSGAAIAATGDDREQAEQAVLEDAAGRLDVTPEDLHGGIGHWRMIEDLAEALGMSREDLFEQLRSGQSIAEIAEAQEKDPGDVRQAVRTAQEERLDEAVEAGRITESRRDELLERLDERIERLGEKTGRPFGGPRPDADEQDEAGSADEEAGFTS